MTYRGRPRSTVQRVPLSLRVTPAVRTLIEASAQRSGRSISQEAEMLIEAAFDRQQLIDQVVDAIKPRSAPQ